MTTDELSRLWELLPTDIVDAIGIGDLAASMGLSADRTLQLLNDLVPRGARCCRGDRVGNTAPASPLGRFAFTGSGGLPAPPGVADARQPGQGGLGERRRLGDGGRRVKNRDEGISRHVKNFARDSVFPCNG